MLTMTAITYLILIYGLLLGSCLGSYLACVWYRTPRGISLLGASFCPMCNQPIPPYLNLPVIGWIVLRGKSACCSQPISFHYPLIEFGAGLIGAGVVVFFPWWLSASLVVSIILAPVALTSIYSPSDKLLRDKPST